MLKFRFLAATAAVAACAVWAADAEAQTIKLTAVAASPPTVTPVKVTKEFFIPEVNKRLAASGHNFKIEWTEAYSQTLAKFTEVFETVEEGVAHVGVLLKSFEESKLPLEQYPAMIPFGPTDPAKMQILDAKLRQRVPELDAVYQNYNQVVIAHAASSSMQMFTKFPLTKVDDLKGRKIGSSGALGQVLRGTGAVIVTSSMLTSYTDISNGVYDGYSMAEVLAFPYKTYQAAPYLTKLDFGSVVVAALSVNKKTWDGLPDFVRQIFQETARGWSEAYLDSEVANTKRALEMMGKEGLKTSEFPAAEREKWAKAMPNIAKEWADVLEKKGQPGRKVLATYMDEVRASGMPVLRHWDKE